MIYNSRFDYIFLFNILLYEVINKGKLNGLYSLVFLLRVLFELFVYFWVFVYYDFFILFVVMLMLIL